MPENVGTRRRGQIYAVLAALTWSIAGVLQRELSVSVATQIAGRAFFAVFALLAFVWISERGIVKPFRSMGLAAFAVAGLTAVANITFIIALNHTTVANVLFLQAMSPLVAALIAWVALREAVSRRTAVAMAVAIAGVAVMVGGPGGSRGIGLTLSLVMMTSFAVAVVITRHRRDISMAPAVCLSQVLVLAVAGPFSQPGTIDAHDLSVMAVLGVVQMGGGLAFLVLAARLLPAAEVALITLLEVVLGPLWVWLADSEKPSTSTLVGGAVVVAAVAIQAAGEGDDARSAVQPEVQLEPGAGVRPVSFDVAAESYDRFMGRYSRLLAPQMADLARVKPDHRVLDVGCGPGALTAVLVERAGSVSAVDPSEQFVAAARERHPGVDVALAPAEHLPFPDGAFDAALAQLVVHFMVDPVAGLREMARVTRPGGVVVACVWDHGGGEGPLSLFWEAAHELDPGVADESSLAGATEGHLRELFAEAGLRRLDETSLAVTVQHESFDEWWEPYTFGVGPAGVYAAGLDAERQSRLRERCRALLPPEPFALTARAWTVRGRVPFGFDPPPALVTPELLLEPLGPQHNEADYAAWSSSMEHIHASPGFESWRWPHEMTLAENRADLERHAADYADRLGFTYTVLDPRNRSTIGCLYIYPRREAVVVHSWVRADRAELDLPLRKAVRDWLASDWPFQDVEYAG